jgi:hypothetical protein
MMPSCVRGIVSAAMLLAASAAQAQCTGGTASALWPVEVAVEPAPALAGQPLQAVLGPAGAFGIFPATLVRTGNLVVLQGRAQDYSGIGVPPPPMPFLQPLGTFAPGSYVLRIALTEFDGVNACRVLDVPFVVTGTSPPSPEPVPLDARWLALLACALWLAATASRAARSPRCRSR